eukprot:586564-Pelagomonas_calceolata.AAC.2
MHGRVSNQISDLEFASKLRSSLVCNLQIQINPPSRPSDLNTLMLEVGGARKWLQGLQGLACSPRLWMIGCWRNIL